MHFICVTVEDDEEDITTEGTFDASNVILHKRSRKAVDYAKLSLQIFGKMIRFMSVLICVYDYICIFICFVDLCLYFIYLHLLLIDTIPIFTNIYMRIYV
jgi:hypothetical protein